MNDGFLKDFLDGRKYQTDLLLILLLAILGFAIAIALPDGNIVRIVFGIAMLIFIPGYALVSALWPKARLSNDSESSDGEMNSPSVDNLERVALSFGLSIAVLSITGLLLHFTGIGITLESTVVSNLVLIIALIAIAFFRRAKMPFEEVFHMAIVWEAKDSSTKTDRLITAAIAISLVLAGAALVYSITVPSVENHYSSLFILDANGTASDYPISLNTTTTGTIIVGISCHEFKTTRYTILAGIDGANNTMDYQNWSQIFNLNNSALISRNITLNHQESFEEEFSFRIFTPGTYKVNWAVEMDGAPTDYSTHLWVVVIAD